METKFTNDYEKLESVDFFDLMQCYRIAPQSDQERTIQRFEEVKDYIKENFVPKTKVNSKAPEMFELLRIITLTPAFEEAKDNFGHSDKHWTNRIEQLLKEAAEL